VRGFFGIEVDSLQEPRMSISGVHEIVMDFTGQDGARQMFLCFGGWQLQDGRRSWGSRLHSCLGKVSLQEVQLAGGGGGSYMRYPLKKACNSPSVVAYARFPM
jgi:hypothetical protein